MGMLKGAMKAGIAMKLLEIARREASKPANQQKARDLVAKANNRRTQRRP